MTKFMSYVYDVPQCCPVFLEPPVSHPLKYNAWCESHCTKSSIVYFCWFIKKYIICSVSKCKQQNIIWRETSYDVIVLSDTVMLLDVRRCMTYHCHPCVSWETPSPRSRGWSRTPRDSRRALQCWHNPCCLGPCSVESPSKLVKHTHTGFLHALIFMEV